MAEARPPRKDCSPLQAEETSQECPWNIKMNLQLHGDTLNNEMAGQPRILNDQGHLLRCFARLMQNITQRSTLVLHRSAFAAFFLRSTSALSPHTNPPLADSVAM